MKKKITKRLVDTASRGDLIMDTELPGFGLRVSKGGAKSYVLRYRCRGIQRWYTIGSHGHPDQTGHSRTVDRARTEAIQLLAQVGQGVDPALVRQEMRNAETLAEFSEIYLSDHARSKKKPRSIEEDERNLKNHILPKLGARRLREISRPDIALFMKSMSGAPFAGNRCLALLSVMFNLSEKWGHRPDSTNPCLHVDKYPEKPRERFLSHVELSSLGSVLKDAEGAGESIYVISAIRLLLFTGARLSEILNMQWEHLDFDRHVYCLPDSKTGKKEIPLPAPALQLLQRIPRQVGNPFVICGKKEKSRLVNLQRPWRRIRQKAGLDDVRIHDLRHSYASIAVADGVSIPLIGALLGHKNGATTARYAHMSDDPRQAAATIIASKLDALMGGRSADIVSIVRHKTRVGE